MKPSVAATAGLRTLASTSSTRPRAPSRSDAARLIAAVVLPSQPAGTYFAWVDGTNNTSGNFTLTVNTNTPPGDTCAAAVPITASGMLANETLVGYINDYATDSTGMNCTGFANVGPDKVYSISLTAGQVLTVTMEPKFDGAIYLVAGPTCMPQYTMCLAGADVNGGGAARTETFMYTATAAQQVFLIADFFQSGAGGAYTLNINIQ